MKFPSPKSPRTTTAEALLGMLSLGALSGYEIRQSIKNSIGNFWRESYGQIYPTLKRLAMERLVKVQASQPNSKVRSERTIYELTPAGRRRLRAWLDTPSTPQVARNEMLLKIFFAKQGDPSITRLQVEAFREFHLKELKRFEQIRTGLLRDAGKSEELPYWLMTLDYGESESRAMLLWCEKTLKTVKKLAEGNDA